MNKFYLAQLIANEAILCQEDEHHVLKVLRLQMQDQIIGIFNNHKYLCEITKLKPLNIKILNQLDEDTTNSFVLNAYLASIKPAHMELAITKACELNVNHFYIFNSQWSQGNIKHNLERYQKLIKAACQQANRNQLMEISILDQATLLSSLKQNDLNLIADFHAETKQIQNLIVSAQNHQLGLIVGPEAGFSDDDLSFLKLQNSHIINLTKSILRAETALLYLISVVSDLKSRSA